MTSSPVGTFKTVSPTQFSYDKRRLHMRLRINLIYNENLYVLVIFGLKFPIGTSISMLKIHFHGKHNDCTSAWYNNEVYAYTSSENTKHLAAPEINISSVPDIVSGSQHFVPVTCNSCRCHREKALP